LTGGFDIYLNKVIYLNYMQKDWWIGIVAGFIVSFLIFTAGFYSGNVVNGNAVLDFFKYRSPEPTKLIYDRPELNGSMQNATQDIIPMCVFVGEYGFNGLQSPAVNFRFANKIVSTKDVCNSYSGLTGNYISVAYLLSQETTRYKSNDRTCRDFSFVEYKKTFYQKNPDSPNEVAVFVDVTPQQDMGKCMNSNGGDYKYSMWNTGVLCCAPNKRLKVALGAP